MKKIFLTLIVSIALFGTVFAQEPESHWSDFYSPTYEQHGALVAAVAIDNNMIVFDNPADYYYDELGGYYVNYDYEVAAFVNNVCRGHGFLCYYEGDDYFTTNGMGVYYDNTTSDVGREVSFKLYDHVNEIEYDVCTSSETIVTAQDYWDYWDDVVILYFSTPTFPVNITGYGTGSGDWYLIASPLASAVNPVDVDNMVSNNFDLYRFNQSADKEWENWKFADNYHYDLEPGTGYLYANSGDVTLTFKGKPYSGDGQFELKRDNGAKLPGWNLIGNPYPEAATISRDFYVMNDSRTEVTVSERTSIAPMEGVFVYAANENETVTFNRSRADVDDGKIVVNLCGEKDGVLDRVMVRFGENPMLPKYKMHDGSTTLSVAKQGKEYAVVNCQNENIVPVSFKAGQMASYTLKVRVDRVDVSYLHLIDNITGADVDMLAGGTYTFVGAPNDRNDRFALRLGYNAVEDDMFAYQSGNDVVVNGKGTLQVFDLVGRFVASYDVNGVQMVRMPSQGVYILRLVGDETKTQKIVVR